MIIQCEQCHTKFRLDDSKVTDKGVKVRCAKCKHVFTVVKEQPEEEPAIAFENVLDDTTAFNTPPSLNDSEKTADFGDALSIPEPPPQPTFDEQTISFDMAASAAPSDLDSGDDFSLSSHEEGVGFSKETSGEVDFDTFDFGDAVGGADEAVIAPAKPDFGDETVIQQPAIKKSDDMGGLDFSGDSMFGEVVQQTNEEPASDISFDLQMDDFAASMGVEDASAKPDESPSVSEPADAPFSLGEIDFGEELTSVAVQQVNPDELKPGQDLLFAPLLENQNPVSLETPNDTSRHELPLPPLSSTETSEELPPLSISSRRKQGNMTLVLAALGGLAVIIAAYFGFSSLNSAKTAAPQEKGRILIRSVEASFVKNKAVGDLLVIKGEAVNEYPMSRAAIQVKGMLYGAKGEVLLSKNAFCGNPLTPEQLSTLSLDALESAMANQFGDSLTNMEVLPGKSVPFVVVLAKPGADSKDYGVQAAGSTVAAAK